MAQEWIPDTRMWSPKKQCKQMGRNHPAEFASCMLNLGKVLDELNTGRKIGGFSFNFFRSEGNGVYRIGQSSVKSPCEMRLYVYPDETSKTMFLLTIGDKNTQQKDIQACHEKADELKGRAQ